MDITDNLIAYLEELSRLKLSHEEKAAAKKDMSSILQYMKKLEELDTSQAKELSHAFTFTNVLRKDEEKESFDREAILSNAPARKEGCFKVYRTRKTLTSSVAD